MVTTKRWSCSAVPLSAALALLLCAGQAPAQQRGCQRQGSGQQTGQSQGQQQLTALQQLGLTPSQTTGTGQTLSTLLQLQLTALQQQQQQLTTVLQSGSLTTAQQQLVIALLQQQLTALQQQTGPSLQGTMARRGRR